MNNILINKKVNFLYDKSMQVLHFLENILGGTLVIVVTSITIGSVLALNPTLFEVESGNIAGATTQDQNSDSIIGVINAIPEQYITESFDDSYTIRLEELQEPASFDAFSFTNFSNQTGNIRVEVQYKQSLAGDIKIELVDTIDRIILASPILPPTQRTITVDAQSSRDFQLVISSESPINFPIEFVITTI